MLSMTGAGDEGTGGVVNGTLAENMLPENNALRGVG